MLYDNLFKETRTYSLFISLEPLNPVLFMRTVCTEHFSIGAAFSRSHHHGITLILSGASANIISWLRQIIKIFTVPRAAIRFGKLACIKNLVNKAFWAAVHLWCNYYLIVTELNLQIKFLSNTFLPLFDEYPSSILKCMRHTCISFFILWWAVFVYIGLICTDKCKIFYIVDVWLLNHLDTLSLVNCFRFFTRGNKVDVFLKPHELK